MRTRDDFRQEAWLRTLARGRADGVVAVAIDQGLSKVEAMALGARCGCERPDVHYAWLRAHDYRVDGEAG